VPLSDLQAGADVATAVGVLAATVALFFNWRSLQEQARARRSALAFEYIKRYWQIDDSRRRARGPFAAAARRVDDGRYLTLCEDEYDLMSEGMLDAELWEMWHGCIQADAPELLGTRAGRPDQPSEQLRWLRQCLAAPKHRGVDCPSIKRTAV